jgi:hypothetical protein
MAIHASTNIVDVRALRHTREIVAYRDGGLFPVLTTTSDGTIIAVLRGAAGHLGLPGRIDIIRSLDAGQTWTYPNIVANSERDDRNPGLGTSHKGTLILAYARASSYDEKGNYFACKAEEAHLYWDNVVTRSFDNGLTWEDPYPLGYRPIGSGSPFGKMVTLGDTVLMPIYGRPAPEVVGSRMSQMLKQDTCAYLLRSQDDGKTWGQASVIAINAGEPAVIALPNGDLLALVRREQMGKTLWSAHSSDGGYTWTEPVQVTGDMKHPGDLIQLSNGDIVLAYGNRNSPPYRVEGLVSRDGGHSWLDCLLTFSGHLRGYNRDFPLRVDMGYPSSVIVPGTNPRIGVTMYYYNPAIAPANSIRDTRTGYEAANYAAIAVVWREDELIEAVGRAVQ